MRSCIRNLLQTKFFLPSLFLSSQFYKTMSGSGDSLYRVIFVLGGPGAGKGTQCSKIVEKFGYVHLSAGDLLRAEAKSGGPLAEQINGHMKAGTIVPVAITCSLLEQAMKKEQAASSNKFLVDGFPRNNDNLQGWQKQMESKVKLQAVFVFDCPDDLCVERCMGRGSGRVDDNPDTLKRRLTQFKEECQPVIDHYKNKGIVHVLDASPSADEVFSNVEKILKGFE